MESMEQNIPNSSFPVENSPNVSQFSTGLLSLHEDHIRQILKWLTLDELCMLSQTCITLQRITGEYFHWTYPRKWMRISEASTNLLSVFPNDKVVWCFHPYIRNLEFVFPPPKEVSVNVKNILFNHCSIRRSTSHSISRSNSRTICRDILCNLESVEFNCCNTESNDEYQKILQHCQRIKNLTIIDGYGDTNNEFYLTKCPTLEHVKFKGIKTTEMFTKNVKIFLEQNLNIKSFTWYFDSTNLDADASDFIKTILDGGTNLEELFLSFRRRSLFPHEFGQSSICDELQTLSQRKTFKRLELEFRNEVIDIDEDELASLNFLNGLHLDYTLSYENYMIIVNPLYNLQILNIGTVRAEDNWKHMTPNNFFNLETLIIGELASSSFLKPFIRHCPKLKTVKIISFATYLLSEAAYQQLNLERSELAQACKMTIFVKPSPRFKLNNILANINFSLVRVKFVDFDYNYFFHINKGFNYWSVSDV